MKIFLHSWESKGLRCPDMKVTVADDAHVPKVTLVQMPNGTGKTTTLNMLRAALSGEAQEWSQSQVRDQRPTGADHSHGHFSVQLLVDDKPLTFEITLDFESGTATYNTSSPILGGIRPGHRPHPDWHKFFQPEFVRLFVFDGELAGGLLRQKDNAAQRAIDALCQLYLLERVSQRAQDSWTDATKAGGPKTAMGLARHQAAYDKLQSRKRELEKSLKKAQKRLGQVETLISKRESEVEHERASTEIRRDRLAEISADLQRAEQAQGDATSALLRFIRRPSTVHPNWGSALGSLKTHLDRLRLPESTSRQFFIELAQEKDCLCGREMTDDAAAEVRRRAGDYLGEEISGQLNRLKSAIQTYVVDSGAWTPSDLHDAATDLSSSTVRVETVESEQRVLHNELDAEAPASVREKLAELDDLKEERSILGDVLNDLTAPTDPVEESNDDTTCLAAIAKQLKAIGDKVASITDTVELRQKTDLVIQLTSSARKRARESISQAILDASNERLAKVLRRSPIRLGSIGESIQLQGQSGASVGQTLSVGYVFLTTLLHRGQHTLPLVVDSPAGPLDGTVRREIAGFLPTLCEQFVAFTINTERPDFVEPLHKAANGDIRYLTLFRSSSGTTDLESALPESGVTRTETGVPGVLVQDQDFFNSFDIRSEG